MHCKPVPMIMLHIGGGPRSQQDRANDAWAELGARMGFDAMTVEPRPGMGNRFFSAVPSENETQRAERETRESEEKRQREIGELTAEIAEKQEKLSALRAAGAGRSSSTSMPTAKSFGESPQNKFALNAKIVLA